MKIRKTLIDQFFKAAGKNDKAFIEALGHLSERGSSVLNRPEVVVKEPTIHYRSSGTSDPDKTSCSVGAALQEALSAYGWNKKLAAAKLEVSETAIERLLDEMMPLTAKSVRPVTRFLCEMHSGASEQALMDCLLNGLHFWELSHSVSGNARMAARQSKKQHGTA